MNPKLLQIRFEKEFGSEKSDLIHKIIQETARTCYTEVESIVMENTNDSTLQSKIQDLKSLWKVDD